MATIRYTLETGSDLVSVTNIGGKTVLVFETDVYNDDDIQTADAQSEVQSDMLWEVFEHSFEVFDEDGNLIEPEE